MTANKKSLFVLCTSLTRLVAGGYEAVMSTDGLTLIAARRAHIDSELSELQKRIDDLQNELVELDQAESVLNRLLGQAGATSSQYDSEENPSSPSGKPPGTPPVTSMIRTALMAAALEGRRGAEPKEISAYIAKNWWQTVTSNDVSPICWRMHKRGQLVKDGSLYMLPENETADALSVGDTPAVSNSQPEA